MFYTERLMLRSPDLEADLKTWTQWLNLEEHRVLMGINAPRPASRDRGKKVFEELMKEADDSGFPIFMVCHRPNEADMPEDLPANEDIFVKDGKPRYPPIGILNLGARRGLRYSSTNHGARLGIAFDKVSVGKGYGTEILTWACAYVFQELNVHRLELVCWAGNAGAIRCYEKIGFVKEGVSKETFFSNGQWQDEWNMAILKHEWQSRQRE